jgi:hypothetical protein
MSVQDETWDRPICYFCNQEIIHGQKEIHRNGTCKKIVNIKSGAKYDLYIGRFNQHYGVSDSIFKNPYIIGMHGDRKEVIEKFKEYAYKKQEILDNLYLIDNQVLGCWCDFDKGEDCHGRILLELREEQKKNEPWLGDVLKDVRKKRVAVVGSRNYNNRDEIFKYLDSKIDKIGHLVSGGCPSGADNIAQIFAKERGLSITIHYPNWDKDGKGAGFIRNKKIVEDCQILIAFTTGSKGTQNSIDLATKLGKKVIIHKIKPDDSKEADAVESTWDVK